MARYRCDYDPRHGQLQGVSEPTLYTTPFTSPQLELIELDDEQWRKFQRRPARNLHEAYSHVRAATFLARSWHLRTVSLGLKSDMKGGEIGLPKCVHCHVAKSTPVHTLVARIKALKGAHTIEPAPERSTARRAATAEESVTTRIRRRIKARSEPQPEADAAPYPPEGPVTPVTPAATAALTLFTVPMPHVSPPKPSYRQRATREEQPAKPQLSLF